MCVCVLVLVVYALQRMKDVPESVFSFFCVRIGSLCVVVLDHD